MHQEYSYGVVPLKKRDGEWFVFMIRHKSGHWTLPKGHAEGNESPFESAQRELFEETGLQISHLLFDLPLFEKYQFASRGSIITKSVNYYIAEVEGQVRIQLEEIQEGKWCLLEEAPSIATYAQMKTLLEQVFRMLINDTNDKRP
ncbi:MAG: NUDIX domain-containing protein [Verrucomicrobia bacterium]|nr:NUDIX domain-containing protein [Verrucomicrobiota bacterium]